MPDHAPDAAASRHAARLDRLAELAVRVGVRIAPGQQLVLTAPLDAAPLVRRITAHAYRAGCSLVTTLFADEEGRRLRFEHAREDSFDTAAGWLSEGMAQAFREGAARMAVTGDDPALLAAMDPARVARANRAASRAYRPVLELITGFATNWSIVSYATPSWARTVFPGLPQDQAEAQLWEAVFAASRVDAPDPVAAWETHNAGLHARTARLDGARLAALHFRGPGTDLRVGLSDGHRWLGGPRPRATASPATRTSPPRRSTPRRTGCRSRARWPPPSRSPMPAR